MKQKAGRKLDAITREVLAHVRARPIWANMGGDNDWERRRRESILRMNYDSRNLSEGGFEYDPDNSRAYR